MRDEEKSSDQLISELQALRRQIAAQNASAGSDRLDSAVKRDETAATLERSRKDLSDAQDETRVKDEELTEVKEALETIEDDLQGVKERYNTLGDLVPFGIWTADSEGQITFLSESFLEMSGIPLEAAADLNWIDRLDRSVVENLVSDWRSTLPEDEIWEGEHSTSSQDGRRYDILIRGVPILDAEKNIVSWLGINLDISKRKRVERELRSHKDKLEHLVRARTRELEAILASVPQHIYILDYQGRFVFANPRLLKLWGLSAEEAIGKTMRELEYPAEVEGPIMDGIQEVLRTRKTVRRETRHAGPGADAVAVYENILALMEGGEDEVDLVAGSSWDITQSKDTETALRLARQEADAANRAKSLFLSNMSHDIRTPLNGILGMIHLAQITVDNPAVKNYLDMANESAAHLLDLINDILDLSRMEAGKSQLRHEPFVLREELDAALGPFAVAARGRSLTIEWTVADDIPDNFLGDKRRLRQVLNNLVGNALKFTTTGTIKIVTERAVNQPEQGLRLLFLIRDTGMGIPADKISSVFETFEQAHASAHAEFGGSGLGLPICKRLVGMMDGDMKIESHEGEGTAVTFSIVLGIDQSPEIRATETGDPGHRGRPLRVLVAEDEKINQIYMQDMLERAGHLVTLARTGREALEQLSKGEFHAVLMDIQMPEMSGDEATRIIRNHPPEGVDREIPVIALTAFALKEEIDAYARSGFTAYLSKPVDMETLNQALSQIASSAAFTEA